jgi:hypothetical protein
MGRCFFAVKAGGAADGEFAFAHGIEEAKFFGDGQRGEAAAEIAFAGKNFVEVEGHGVSLRNCRTKDGGGQ